MLADHIKEIIEKVLPGSEVIIRDFHGTGDHLEANVIWSGFTGMTRVDQHRKVYEAIGNLMGGAVHALTMKTWAKKPEELASPSEAYFGGGGGVHKLRK